MSGNGGRRGIHQGILPLKRMPIAMGSTVSGSSRPFQTGCYSQPAVRNRYLRSLWLSIHKLIMDVKGPVLCSEQTRSGTGTVRTDPTGFGGSVLCPRP